MRSRLLYGLSVGVPATSAVVAQSPRPLGPPTLRLRHDFIHIAGVRELPSGSLLISDDRDGVLVFADTAGATRRIGREGAGPKEYARPGTLLAMPHGRSLLLDPGNARFLELGADGEIVRTISASSARMLALAASWDARGTDQSGRVYFEQLPGPLRPGERHAVAIARWTPATGRMDTVATYFLSEAMQTLSPEVRGREALIHPRAWPARPEWAVTPDGRIALAEPAPYRISTLLGTLRTEGPEVTYVPIRVTEQDRLEFREALAGARAGRGPPGTEPPRPPGSKPPLHKTGAQPIFPDSKPPFSGREAFRVGPDGTAWVTRTLRAGDSAATVDLFETRNGKRIAQVLLPARSRVVGFGKGVVYVARRDADDLEQLERYRLP